MIGSFLTNKKGTVLVTAYVAVFALSILAVAAIQRATTEYNFAERYRLSTEAYYLAEAGSELVAYALARKVANYEPEPVGPTDSWEELHVSNSDFLSSGFDLECTCDSMDSDQTFVSPEGVVTVVRHFNITATAADEERGVSATINQVIARRKTFAFQHAVFYAGDLEILPGDDMILSGKVHSNNDIYIAANATLVIDAEYLKSAGGIYNFRKDSGSEMEGEVKILKKGTLDYAPMQEDWEETPLDSTRGDWITASQSRWGGTAKSSVHGVTSLAVPEIGSIQPDGYYARKADIKVVNGSIYKGETPLVEGVDIPHGTIATKTDFYDQREDKWSRMTNIDLEKLAGWTDVDNTGEEIKPGENVTPAGKSQIYPNHLPGNGLLYATRNDAGSNELPAIRLVNGTRIESPSGLTVVSNDPVYVEGDYNTLDKKPAAVICDAFNILSNDWDDANSASGESDREASDTTVNTAIVSGIYPTSDGDYSGGLENLPRLHEDWEDVTLFIRGSFVMLWDSQTAKGSWESADYTPPVRDWDYDTDFFNSSNLPAYTPYAVEVERVAWWKKPVKYPSRTPYDLHK